jgi:hypothetical protein
MRDQVSHPYKTIGKTVSFLCFNICIQIEVEEEYGNGFEINKFSRCKVKQTESL